jgi:hypothetical protein
MNTAGGGAFVFIGFSNLGRRRTFFLDKNFIG